jgi:hypothetical protein
MSEALNLPSDPVVPIDDIKDGDTSGQVLLFDGTAWGASSPDFKSSLFRISDSTLATKKLSFNLSNLANPVTAYVPGTGVDCDIYFPILIDSGNLMAGSVGYNGINLASSNTAYGNLAGTNLTDGTSNALFGDNAGNALLDGNYNTAIGASALSTPETVHRNICIGASTTVNAGVNDCIVLGYDISATASGQLKIRSPAAGQVHGRATLVGGTVTVNSTSVTATTNIFVTCQSPAGTPGFLRISARVANTSFTILSSSGTDTSEVAYLLIEP